MAKRILFINHTGGIAGGETVFIDAIRAASFTVGLELHVVYPNDNNEKFKNALKDVPLKKIFRLPYRVLRNTPLLAFRNLVFSALSIPYLAYYCLWNKIDIICSNTSVNIVGIITAMILGKKHIWYIHELSTSHHRWTPRQLDKMYCKCFLDRLNYSIFVSKATKDAWQKQIGAEIIRSEVLYSRYKNIKIEHCLLKPFTFGFLGGLDLNKNVGALIDAFSHIPEAKLIIGGSGRMLESLKNKARMIGRDQDIEFWGQVDDLSKFYSSVDVLVQVSFNESWGLVALEAISAEKAVIMTTNTGLKEILKSTEGIVYVDPMNVDQIRHEMIVMMNDVEYRNRVVRLGQDVLAMLDLNNNFDNRINRILNEA